MAQDGYPRANAAHHFDQTDSRTQHPQSCYQNDQFKSSSRHSSADRGDPRGRPAPEPMRFSQPQRPVDEAVSTAFDKANMSGINPDLIAQITQNVLKQLRTGGETGTPVTATQTSYPPHPTQQPAPPSPSTQSATSHSMPERNVYTPPSPQKHFEYPNHGSPDSKAPPYDSPPSPRDQDDRRPSSQISTGSDANTSRPRGPVRLSTSKEETTLEKIWGPLFKEDGTPTLRLSQFLRGLAVHLVSK